MEKIFEKLSLYEILAYFIPGSIFVSILWVLLNFYGFDIKAFFVYKNPLIDTILILFGSYFAGIIIHEIGEFIQVGLKKRWGGFPSERFMDINSKILNNTNEIEQYKNFAKDKFSLEIVTNKDADLFFHRTRGFLKDDSGHNESDLINNNYGMCRSFLAISVVYLALFIINLIRHWFNLNDFLIVLFWGTIVYILARRLRRFGETYVKKVLRGGYAKFMKEG